MIHSINPWMNGGDNKLSHNILISDKPYLKTSFSTHDVKSRVSGKHFFSDLHFRTQTETNVKEQNLSKCRNVSLLEINKHSLQEKEIQLSKSFSRQEISDGEAFDITFWENDLESDGIASSNKNGYLMYKRIDGKSNSGNEAYDYKIPILADNNCRSACIQGFKYLQDEDEVHIYEEEASEQTLIKDVNEDESEETEDINWFNCIYHSDENPFSTNVYQETAKSDCHYNNSSTSFRSISCEGLSIEYSDSNNYDNEEIQSVFHFENGFQSCADLTFLPSCEVQIKNVSNVMDFSEQIKPNFGNIDYFSAEHWGDEIVMVDEESNNARTETGENQSAGPNSIEKEQKTPNTPSTKCKSIICWKEVERLKNQQSGSVGVSTLNDQAGTVYTPGSKGEDAWVFTDQELEHVFEEEETKSVSLGSKDHLFMDEFPQYRNIRVPVVSVYPPPGVVPKISKEKEVTVEHIPDASESANKEQLKEGKQEDKKNGEKEKPNGDSEPIEENTEPHVDIDEKPNGDSEPTEENTEPHVDIDEKPNGDSEPTEENTEPHVDIDEKPNGDSEPTEKNTEPHVDIDQLSGTVDNDGTLPEVKSMESKKLDNNIEETLPDVSLVDSKNPCKIVEKDEILLKSTLMDSKKVTEKTSILKESSTLADIEQKSASNSVETLESCDINKDIEANKAKQYFEYGIRECKCSQNMSQRPTCPSTIPIKCFQPGNVTVVRRVGSDALLIRWDPPNSSVYGYEVWVNGLLSSKVCSSWRTRTMLHHLNLRQKQVIAVYGVSPCGATSKLATCVYDGRKSLNKGRKRKSDSSQRRFQCKNIRECCLECLRNAEKNQVAPNCVCSVCPAMVNQGQERSNWKCCCSQTST